MGRGESFRHPQLVRSVTAFRLSLLRVLPNRIIFQNGTKRFVLVHAVGMNLSRGISRELYGVEETEGVVEFYWHGEVPKGFEEFRLETLEGQDVLDEMIGVESASDFWTIQEHHTRKFRQKTKRTECPKKSYQELWRDPRWQRKRLEVMKRDDFACRACARTDITLCVHHLRYNGKPPWECEDDDVQTLCETCHKALGPHPKGGVWWGTEEFRYESCPMCGNHEMKDKGSYDKCVKCGHDMFPADWPDGDRIITGARGYSQKKCQSVSEEIGGETCQL